MDSPASLDSSKVVMVLGCNLAAEEKRGREPPLLRLEKNAEPKLTSDTSNKSCMFPKSDF